MSSSSDKVGDGGGGGGSRFPSRGFFTGSGLIVALVGGGLALNASLFNGAPYIGPNSRVLLNGEYTPRSGWWSPCNQVH